MSLAFRHDRSRRTADADLAPPTDDENGRGEHPKSLRTFIYEVFAGRPKGVGDATDAVDRRVDAAHLPQAPATPIEPSLTEPSLIEPTPVADASVDVPLTLPAATPRTATRAVRSARRRAIRRWPGWSASLVTHALAVVLLTAVTIAQSNPVDEIELSIGPEPIDDFPIAEAEFASESQPEEPADEALSELLDPGAAALAAEPPGGSLDELTDVMALTGESRAAGATGPLGEVGALFGDAGSGLTVFGTGLGAAPLEPMFFGAKIEGRRIVFVLDNSGSMQAGRLETVNAELERCVASLDPEQEFYVIYYSDMIYPLFYPDPVDRYVRPTERNKARLHEWLDSVELCLGDAVLDALNAAASIEPDTVILLSDGRIAGERKMAALLAGGGNFPLHTIGVGLGDGAVASRRNLADVAAANGGDFREAEVPDEMRELSRRNPRPYHNQGPGPIWGRNVKPRR